MKFFQFVIVFFVATFLTACAGTSIKPETRDKLHSGNVAVMYHMKFKQINYEEMVYKVLWNETRQQNAAFTDFWDIDKDLSQRYSQGLNGYGINARPIQQLLPDEAKYDALKGCVVAAQGENPLKLTPELTNEFENMGIDFLIAIRSTHFYGTTTSVFNILTVHMPSVLMIYDIKTGEEIYSELFYVGGGNIKYEKSPREIEKNGLKKLKDATHEWLNVSIQKRLPDVLMLATE